jgi:hypothetical protein
MSLYGVLMATKNTLFLKKKKKKKKKSHTTHTHTHTHTHRLCHFFVHTCFLEGRYMSLEKAEIDKACKDTEHFEDSFRVEAIFGRAEGDDAAWDDWGGVSAALPGDASEAARKAFAAGEPAAAEGGKEAAGKEAAAGSA